MSNQVADKETKSSILKLAAVTYGLVILTTAIAVFVYYRVWGGPPKEDDLFDRTGSVAVGSLWVPVYPGALLEGQTADKNGESTRTTFRMNMSAKPHDVVEFYKTRMKASPFHYTNAGENETGGTVFATARAGKATIFVTVKAASGGAHTEITTVEKSAHP